MAKKAITFKCGCKWNANFDENQKITSVDYDPEKAPLDCPGTWNMLSEGLALGTFQLESDLGCSLSKRVKPRNIDELAQLISVMRPGTMDSVVDGKTLTNHYIDRKHGKEKSVPLVKELEAVTENTRHILLYQEQVMQAAQILAGFDGIQSRVLQKAMGKKKPEVMADLKEKFINGCIGHSQFNREQAERVFDTIEANQRYSFNKCLSLSTTVELEDGSIVTIDEVGVGQKIKDHNAEFTTVVNKYENGKKQCFQVTLESGKTIICTLEHKFLCSNGKIIPLSDIFESGRNIVTAGMLSEKIVEIKYVGNIETMDIEVDNDDHLFIADGFVTSNSHAAAYALNNYYFSAYTKFHFPKAFFTGQLEFCSGDHDKMFGFINEAKSFDIEILKPDLRIKNDKFVIDGKNIRYSLAHIKFIGKSKVKQLIECLENVNLNSINFHYLLIKYLDKCVDSRAIESLIKSGSLDFLGLDRLYMMHNFDIYRKLNKSHQEYCKNNIAPEKKLVDLLKEMKTLGSGKFCPCKNIRSLQKLNDIIELAENPGESLKDNNKIKCQQELQTTGYKFSLSIDKTFPGLNCNCKKFKDYPVSKYKDGGKYKRTEPLRLACEIFNIKKLTNTTIIDVMDETGFIKGIFLKDNVRTKYNSCIQKHNRVILIGSKWNNEHFGVEKIIQI